MKRLLLASLFATMAAVFALPAAARTTVDFYVEVAPPAPYYEPVPVARPGWAWAPGYWDWRGHRHHWVAGHWLRARPGYVFASPHWYASGGRWYLDHGGYRVARDSDHDGVPDYRDRYAYNPYRY